MKNCEQEYSWLERFPCILKMEIQKLFMATLWLNSQNPTIKSMPKAYGDWTTQGEKKDTLRSLWITSDESLFRLRIYLFCCFHHCSFSAYFITLWTMHWWTCSLVPGKISSIHTPRALNTWLLIFADTFSLIPWGILTVFTDRQTGQALNTGLNTQKQIFVKQSLFSLVPIMLLFQSQLFTMNLFFIFWENEDCLKGDGKKWWIS